MMTTNKSVTGLSSYLQEITGHSLCRRNGNAVYIEYMLNLHENVEPASVLRQSTQLPELHKKESMMSTQ